MILSVLPESFYRQKCLRTSRNGRRGIVIPVTIIAFCIMIFILLTMSETYSCAISTLVKKYDRAYAMHTNVVIRKDGKVYKYDRSSPLIFISGVNLSGSELLRDILDSHPDIRCTGDGHIIPRLLRMQSIGFIHKNESVRLKEAGISKGVMDAAIGAFTLELMARSGEPAEYLCNQDFSSIRYADDLSRIFPQSKFLLVVRDPLHFAHTKLQEHNLPIFNKTLFNEYLQDWDQEMLSMKTACRDVLSRAMNNRPRCRIIHYETLFLRPRLLTLSVLKFIFPDVSSVYVPKTMLSKLQPGTNVELQGWFGNVPKRAVMFLDREKFHTVGRLGYGQIGYPPNYHLLYGMLV